MARALVYFRCRLFLGRYLWVLALLIFPLGNVEAATWVENEQAAWDSCNGYIQSPPFQDSWSCVRGYVSNDARNVCAMTTNWGGGACYSSWNFLNTDSCPNGNDNEGCLDPPPSCDYYTTQSPDLVGDCPSVCYETDVGIMCTVFDADPWTSPDGDVLCGPLGDGGLICQNPAQTDQCFTGDQPGLYSNETCYSPDATCAYLNGEFGCLEPKQDDSADNCGYFNDEYVCVDFNGSLIPSDSPDHPSNGGNADGDPTNDDSGVGTGASDGKNEGGTTSGNTSDTTGTKTDTTECVEGTDAEGNKIQTCTTSGSVTTQTDYGDVTIPGIGENQFYTPSGKTAVSVLGDFKRDLEQLPIVQSVTGFFDVQVSGVCPVWSTPAVWVFDPIVIDAQCSEAMNLIWPGIAAIVIASAAFLAFRWAVL